MHDNTSISDARGEGKQAMDRLHSQKEWFRVTLSSIGDAVIATDTRGRVMFLNAAAEQLTGWDEEAEGVPLAEVFKIINEETREPVEDPVVKALREDATVGLTGHTLLIRKDGGEVSIADSAAPIRNAAGETVGVVLVFRDVTEQRRAEIAVRDARRYAENIVDTVRHPLLVLDSQLRVQTASRSFYRAFRVSAEETEGRRLFELGNGQWDIPELRRLLDEVLPRDASFEDFEVEHEFPSIGYRYMRLNARRLYREGNHSEQILLAIEDVTERRRAEEERRKVETRFTSLVKTIRDHAIFTLDPAGCITSWNIEAERILGYSEQEAIGQHFSMIFTPEDVEHGAPQQEIETALAEGRAEDERWHQRKSGELLWALGIVTPTTDAAGNHTGFSKILRDMTERRRAQEALLRQSQQLRLLWESAAVLLSAPDPKAMIEQTFRRISEHLEVDAYFNFVVDEQEECLRLVACGGIDEDLRKSIERLEFGEAVCGRVALRRQPIVATAIQQSTDSATELVRSNGIRAYACNPLIVGDRLIGTLSFASRRVDGFADEELALFETLSRYVTFAYARLRLVEDLQAADQRKDEFLAMLAHELRNPLAPIRSGLDILAMEQTEHRDTIELLQGQVTHLVRLVDDLMDVSRIMRGKIELRRETVDLARILQQSVQAIRPMIAEQQQELDVSLPDEPVLLDADPVRVAQVVENLLNNAAKYTDAGGRIELAAERCDGEALVVVRDTGIGIAPELLPVIFDLFTQSTGSLDRAQGGLGIGLTLVKNLVEMHGGTVSARSKGLGRGSEFLVRLPLARPGRTSAPAPETERASAGRRILAVDDNQGAARMLSLLLGKLGNHAVEMVHDGDAALAKIQQFRPEIVFLDIGLPGKDGYQVAREIRQVLQLDDVLLVALTGYGQEEDQRRSEDAGFDEHLVKPPSIDQIRRVLTHPKLAK